MCGIFGHTSPGKQLVRSRAALKTLAHRGPDQQNEWYDSEVYIGHQRLSILDLSKNGQQPMEHNGVVISVNGEIYNYQKLKKDLPRKYKFLGRSDSEVVLHGYTEWGIDGLLERLEGMYALTIYDEAKQLVFLARDRVGVKPLYYSTIKNRLAWASELKALQTFYANEKLQIDRSAIYDFLTYRYVPTPKTMYKEIHKLPPAYYLAYNLKTKERSLSRYWKLETQTKKISIKQASETAYNLVCESVKEQLMSDVPVGFFLSGGMDSSVVVAVASKYIKQLNTYSIGFDVAEHDETHFAEIVAKAFNTKHIRKELSVEEVKSSFKNIRKWYDEPFADTSAFPVYKVSELARASSTVVLTGDGGDEVFGGYNWYSDFKFGVKEYVKKAHQDLSLKERLGSVLLRRKNEVELELEFYTKLMGGLTKKEKLEYRKKLKIPASYDDYWYFKKFYDKDLPIYTRLQYMDFNTYLHDDILTKVDRVSMSVALECRVPLLSTKLIKFMFSVPEKVRFHDNELKGLMKYAFSDTVPAEIISRRKKGFSIPTGRWKGQLMQRGGSMQEYILNELYQETIEE